MKYYSQLTQDKWILEEMFPDIRGGIFIEIGAGNGLFYSNSKALEENDWEGLCVEPSWSNIKEFLDNRQQTRLDIRCVYDGSLVRFKEILIDSTLSGIRGEFSEEREDRSRSNFLIREIPSVKLHDLLDEWNMPNTIHYLSIDTEGTEPVILKNYDFSYEIKAMTVEHNYNQNNREEIYDILTREGYDRVREVKQDDYYVLKG